MWTQTLLTTLDEAANDLDLQALEATIDARLQRLTRRERWTSRGRGAAAVGLPAAAAVALAVVTLT